MIPRSTTLSAEGRRIRGRLVWGGAVLATLAVLAVVFAALDRSTVVDGPSGSSHVTTSTGIAALYEVLRREGRGPHRLERPISSDELVEAEAYLLADVGLVGFEPVELESLAEFVDGGGVVLVLGLPPRPLLDGFEIEIEWTGSAVGRIAVSSPTPSVTEIDGPRFGAFTPGHGGRVVAGSPAGDLAVAFDRGSGAVVLIADAAVAHNATIARADNINFLGEILSGRTVFDEYRHGFRDLPAGGLLDGAPGNWQGALGLGAVVLLSALVAYGRRFGPPEPVDRVLAPDRALFLDSVSRSLRRTGDAIPTAPLRTAVLRELGLAPDATESEMASRARAAGVEEDVARALGGADLEAAFALDAALATLVTRKGPR